jgi:protein SCO1
MTRQIIAFSRTMSKFSTLAIVGAALAFTFACRSHVATLPNYGEVPQFTLTAHDGQTFDSSALHGKIWVTDFIFTTCPGPCPRMTSRMHQLQQATSNLTDVRLISFTVDPVHDTPHQLGLYAKAFQAVPSRWYFLTGPQHELDHLGFDVFKLNHVDGAFEHSTRFVLVDQGAHIRGYYDTSDPHLISKLVADIHLLEPARTLAGEVTARATP